MADGPFVAIATVYNDMKDYTKRSFGDGQLAVRVTADFVQREYHVILGEEVQERFILRAKGLPHRIPAGVESIDTIIEQEMAFFNSGGTIDPLDYIVVYKSCTTGGKHNTPSNSIKFRDLTGG